MFCVFIISAAVITYVVHRQCYTKQPARYIDANVIAEFSDL